MERRRRCGRRRWMRSDRRRGKRRGRGPPARGVDLNDIGVSTGRGRRCRCCHCRRHRSCAAAIGTAAAASRSLFVAAHGRAAGLGRCLARRGRGASRACRLVSSLIVGTGRGWPRRRGRTTAAAAGVAAAAADGRTAAVGAGVVRRCAARFGSLCLVSLHFGQYCHSSCCCYRRCNRLGRLSRPLLLRGVLLRHLLLRRRSRFA